MPLNCSLPSQLSCSTSCSSISSERAALPWVKESLSHYAGLYSPRLRGHWINCRLGGLQQQCHLTRLQKHAVSSNCTILQHPGALLVRFWGTQNLLRESSSSLPCCWEFFHALCCYHTDSIQHLACSACSFTLRLCSKLSSRRLWAASPRVAAETSCLPGTETLRSQVRNVI